MLDLDSDAGTELEELVMEVSESSENRRWKLTDTK
jgi:hypothetical protein